MTTSVKEIWKDVVGYEGLYEVSSLGRVRSLDRIDCLGRPQKGKTMSLIRCTNKYLSVVLCKEGKQKRGLIHRLVAEAFLPNDYNKEEVDHINTIRSDNRVENLRWATRSENRKNPLSVINMSNAHKGRKLTEEHKKKLSIINKGKGNGFYGKKHDLNALKKMSIPVCQYTINGEFVAEYIGASDAQRKTGVGGSHITACCKGRYRTAKGYIWKYKE